MTYGNPKNKKKVDFIVPPCEQCGKRYMAGVWLMDESSMSRHQPTGTILI